MKEYLIKVRFFELDEEDQETNIQVRFFGGFKARSLYGNYVVDITDAMPIEEEDLAPLLKYLNSISEPLEKEFRFIPFTPSEELLKEIKEKAIEKATRRPRIVRDPFVGWAII